MEKTRAGDLFALHGRDSRKLWSNIQAYQLRRHSNSASRQLHHTDTNSENRMTARLPCGELGVHFHNKTPPPPIKPEVLAIQVGTPKKDKFSLHVFCVLSKFVHRLSNVYQVSESAVWTSTNILFLSLYWYKPSSVLDEIMVQWVKTSAVPLQSSRKVGSENNDVAEMQTVQWLCYSSKAASSATLSCEARRWERKTAVK